MVVGAAARLGVSMHQGGDQARHGVQKVVFGIDRDLVGLDGGGIGADDDLAFGAQLVAGPPQPDLAGAEVGTVGAPRLWRDEADRGVSPGLAS